jgi:hypothetical protein
MSAALIITPGIGSAIVTAAEAARHKRDDLLTAAGLVTTVADRIDADDAMEVFRSLKGFSKEIETQHRVAKAPVLDLGRKIDAIGKELVAKIDTEANRIGKVIGAYEQEERRKAEDARRAAEAEAAKIAAEAERQAALARAKVRTDEERARVTDAVVEQAAAQIVQVRQAAAAIAPPKTEGLRLNDRVCFEVDDVKAMYAAFPELCVIEPNGAAIRAILKANPELKVPGLRHWREAKVSV